MRPTRDDLNRTTVGLDDAGPVPVPGPSVRCRHRFHDALVQQLGQWLSEQKREGVREQVHSHVVVRPAFARRRPVYLGALTKTLRINAGWFAPQLTLPLAGLLQKVAPGDPVAPRSLELGNANNLVNWLVEH